MAKWLEILKKAKLNTFDKQVLQRYSKNPKSLYFLSVAELLRKHGAGHEAIALLEQGLRHHQNLGTAWVLLSQLYFEQGLVEDSVDALQKAKGKKNNKTAVLLNLKHKVLHKDWKAIEDELPKLFALFKGDSLLEKVQSLLASGYEETLYRDVLKETGLTYFQPKRDESKTGLTPKNAPKAGNANTTFQFQKDSLKSFKRVESLGFFCNTRKESDDSNFDAETLAALYENSGKYRESYEIYKKLSTENPTKDSYRFKMESLWLKLASPEQKRVKNQGPFKRLEITQIQEEGALLKTKLGKLKKLHKLLKVLDTYDNKDSSSYKWTQPEPIGIQEPPDVRNEHA